MKIVVTGNGKSGSWRVRGEQLGAAIGATLAPKARSFYAADVVICVKNVDPSTLQSLRRSGTRWVWDVVDAWKQPEGNAWTKEQALNWLRACISPFAPSGIVFPTTTMHRDSGWPGPALVLPHHAWPKYRPVEIRPEVLTVGYEGGEHYLGAWRPVLERECARRSWAFIVNGDMQRCDIGIALRGANGYPARNWKSNCKLANLQALGIPAVCSPERGYQEFGSGTEIYVETPADLAIAFEKLRDATERRRVSQAMLSTAPTLERVADIYKQWLSQQNF